MWFKNLRICRLSAFDLDASQLEELLTPFSIKPMGATDRTTVGWTQFHPGDDSLVHAYGSQFLLTLRIASKLLPARVINQETQRRAREIEEQQGYKPGRKQLREIKELVSDDLLPSAFELTKDVRVWLDTKYGWLVIDTASNSVSDAVMAALAKALDPFPVKPVYTQKSVSQAMTEWLVSDSPPAGFSVDQESEFQGYSEHKPKASYRSLSLSLEDVKRHVQAGRSVSKLGLTWNDRVSFVLTDGLDVRRVTPLDILREGQVPAADAREQFNNDFALMTGELSLLIRDLVEALGGEKRD